MLNSPALRRFSLCPPRGGLRGLPLRRRCPIPTLRVGTASGSACSTPRPETIRSSAGFRRVPCCLVVKAEPSNSCGTAKPPARGRRPFGALHQTGVSRVRFAYDNTHITACCTMRPREERRSAAAFSLLPLRAQKPQENGLSNGFVVISPELVHFPALILVNILQLG